MDDKIIYYLALGAIYLISRLLKKKKPVQPKGSQPSVDTSQEYQQPSTQYKTPPKSSSFEDLLKEISQEFTGSREPERTFEEVVEPEEVFEPVVVQNELTTEEKYVQKRRKEIAFEDKKKNEAKLNAEKNKNQPYQALELLQEEGGLANAIILTEILTPKY